MDCQVQGVIRPATDVHHVAKIANHPELRLDPLNLMALCRACHATRTGKGE
jgi:5-methylcytosine-specific restriction endonuclease McrA